jgi:succinoglycan biosynthesis transport protein ExoP
MESSSEMDLKRILRLLYRKKKAFVVIAALVTSAVVIGGYLLPKTYEAKSVIFIERNVLNELLKDVAVTSSFEEKAKALSVVMKSRSLILKAMSDLNMDAPGTSPDESESIIRSMQERIKIDMEFNKATRKDTDVFVVSYTDAKPRLASDFVNTLVRRYIAENVSSKREQAFGASTFLLDQLDAFKTKLDKIETSIARQRKDTTTSEKPDSGYERYERLMGRKNELLLQYTESHPEVQKINDEIALARQQLGSAKSAAPNTGLMDLMRERDTTKKIYEDLLSTLGKSEVSAQIEAQDKAGAFRILDPAIEPGRPVSPNMAQIILLALAGGIGAAAGFLMLLDMSDGSVKSAEALKRTGLPVLAVISTMRTEQQIAAAKRGDRRLYAAAGLFLAGLLAMASMEVMGITAVDKFVQQARGEVRESLKKMMQKT